MSSNKNIQNLVAFLKNVAREENAKMSSVKRKSPKKKTVPAGRKAPAESAKDFKFDTKRKGLDGSMYYVAKVKYKNGFTKRWKKVPSPNPMMMYMFGNGKFLV